MTVSAARAFAPGDVLELTLGEAVHGGWCVARQDEEPGGMVVFVRHGLPGERVRAVVTDATTRFARADATEIVRPAAERVNPPCPYARPAGCGGCDWQHASLPAQRAIKATIISQQLQRIAGIDRAVLVEELPGADDGLGWRTRVRFAVRPDGVAGLRKHRSHEIVPVADCLIAHQCVRQADVTRRRWPGAKFVDAAIGAEPHEVAIIPDRGRTGRSGPQDLTQYAAGRTWRVSAAGFWQVHPGAADALTAAVLTALLPEPGETALDLFCGAGLFAGVLADAVGPEGAVVGVEHDAVAVRDAMHNLRDVPWARVVRGDSAAVLARDGLAGASVAVLDPPRTGAERALIAALSGGGLRRIAYVSCDPATLARDLAEFARYGWRLADLRAFDAFPMTHHVECVATLAPDS